MPSRLFLALLTFTLVVGVASADPHMGRSPGKGRGYSRDRDRPSHSNDGRKVFTSALQHLQKSIAKHKSSMPPQPGLPVVPTPPATEPETTPAAKAEPEPTPVVNPEQVPNPLANVKPVIAATAEDEEDAGDETPPPLSSGAIAAIIAGIVFGMLLVVGLTVMIVHQRRATPRYRRPRHRDEMDETPTDV
jgi:hypothetical protein